LEKDKMAYFLGRDVTVAVTTEDADYGVEVNGVTKGTFTDEAGTANTVFAGPLLAQNGTSVFGTQADGAGTDYSNEVSDLTGIDLGIGVTDEDITYMGQKSVLKAEIKKETTVSLTRKKSDAVWDVIFNDGARWGVNNTSFDQGLADPGIGTFGYRIHIQLKSGTEIFTVRNACITSHSTTFNADGTSEETMEFMSYLDPTITTTASNVTATTTDF
jgi:hypothetical protein